MFKGVVFRFDETIDDIAVLLEQARLLASVMTILRRQYSSHENFDVLFQHIERRRAILYSEMESQIGNLLNGVFISRSHEADDDD